MKFGTSMGSRPMTNAVELKLEPIDIFESFPLNEKSLYVYLQGNVEYLMAARVPLLCFSRRSFALRTFTFLETTIFLFFSLRK